MFSRSARDINPVPAIKSITVSVLLSKAPDFNKISSIVKNQNLNKKSNYTLILDYLNNVKPIKGYFFNEFSPEGKPINATKPRKYYTAKNAAKIDAIRKEIKRLKKKNLITDIEHSLLLHDLIMASNDIANIAGTYGHYLSKFVKRAESPMLLYQSKFSSLGRTEGKVFKGYAEEIAPKLVGDICYIDPPYIKRQYAANFYIRNYSKRR